MKILPCFSLFVVTSSLLFPAMALAQEAGSVSTDVAAQPMRKGSVGVGIEQTFGSQSAVSMNYDGGSFHTGVFAAFDDQAGDGNYAFDFGARFYYHVHQTAMTDFGLGGNLAVQIAKAAAVSPGLDAETATSLVPQLGFEIRSFLNEHIALSFQGGITIGLADAEFVNASGDLYGTAGVHYYFF